MKARVAFIVGACLMVMSLALQSAVTYACSCGSIPARQKLNESASVFAGKVTGAQSERQVAASGTTSTRNTYTIEVSTIWKGALAKQIEVVSYSDIVQPTPTGLYATTSCDELERMGHTLDVGETYLVFAKPDPQDGKLELPQGACAYTWLLSESTDDLEDLGTGQSVNAPTGMPGTGESTQYWWVVVVGLGAVAAGVLARRNRSK